MKHAVFFAVLLKCDKPALCCAIQMSKGSVGNASGQIPTEVCSIRPST